MIVVRLLLHLVASLVVAACAVIVGVMIALAVAAVTNVSVEVPWLTTIWPIEDADAPGVWFSPDPAGITLVVVAIAVLFAVAAHRGPSSRQPRMKFGRRRRA